MNKWTFPFLLGALGFSVLGACSGDTESGPQRDGTTASSVDRAAQARELLAQGMWAAPRQKLAFYERLIALYPDSEEAPRAHSLLIQSLLDESVDDVARAKDVVRSFSARHPGHPECVEAWWWLALRSWDDPDDGAFLEEWGRFLAQVATSDSPPESRARAQLHRAYDAHRKGEVDRAVQCLRQGLDVQTEDSRLRFDLAFRLGSLLAKEGDKPGARAAFEMALATGSEIRGAADLVRRELEQLGS